MDHHFGDQYCPFCDKETFLTLKEHGKTCPDYTECVKDHICPFCATQIDECYNKQHDRFRYVIISIHRQSHLKSDLQIKSQTKS